MLEGHKITSFSPEIGIVGETVITIYGKGFLESGNVVRVGCYEIIKENIVELKVKLPYSIGIGNNMIEVDIYGTVAKAEDLFFVESRWNRINDFPEEVRVGGYFGINGNYGYLFFGREFQKRGDYFLDS